MKIRVLFLASNPENLTRLQLAKEVEEIRSKIQASDFGGDIEIVPHWHTKPDDLIQLFNQDDDWQIVHYSGHGSKAHEILLMDDDGQSKPVSKEALQRVFARLGKRARVAVFNACYAEGQAAAVTEHIDCAVGMSKAVGDRAAILFAASFYRAIGFGKSVQDAFEQGLLAIDLEGIAETETPQLRCRVGLDPDCLHLLSGGRPDPVQDEWTRLAPPTPALNGNKWHAFLSYRSVNRPWVLNLHDVLHHHGYGCFLDQLAIRPGQGLEERLEDGLRNSRTGVLIWSQANADSVWCMKEYETLRERQESDENFHFVTLRLGGELPREVQGTVWIDFDGHPDGPNGGGLLRLLHALADQPLSPQAVKFAAEQDQEGIAAERAIAGAISNGKPQRLVELFENGGVAWNSSAALGSKAAEGLTKLGAYDQALEMLEAVQRRFPRSVRPKQLQALAHARRGGEGDLDRAQDILAILRADGQEDPETLGIYARTWMDKYRESGKRVHLKRSRKLYADAFAHAPDDTYTGINAAAKSVFLGEIDQGREYARRVVDVLAQSEPADYWQRAALAEANLILGNYQEAAEQYGDAVLEAAEEKGSRESTLGQAELLKEALGMSEEEWGPIADSFEDV